MFSIAVTNTWECKIKMIPFLYFHRLSTSTVLSPVLFTLYTNDCTGTDTTPVINALWWFRNRRSFQFRLFILLKLKGSATGAGIECKENKGNADWFEKSSNLVILYIFTDGVKVERVTEYRYLGTVLTSWILTKTLTLFTKDDSQEYFAFKS